MLRPEQEPKLEFRIGRWIPGDFACILPTAWHKRTRASPALRPRPASRLCLKTMHSLFSCVCSGQPAKGAKALIDPTAAPIAGTFRGCSPFKGR